MAELKKYVFILLFVYLASFLIKICYNLQKVTQNYYKW